LRASRSNASGRTYSLYDGVPVCELDSSGNVAQRTGSNGAMLSTDLYDGFGKKRAGPADVLGFGEQAGYYTDMETGLVLCTNRRYDPRSGRFLSRDPLGYGRGINLYGYTASNPVTDSIRAGMASCPT